MELATLSAIASIASAGVTAVGTIAAGNAAAAQGEMARAAAEFEAVQLEQQGKEDLAISQREMLQARRQKNLALSSLTTKAAASGFTATDPTSLALADEISRYGTYQEQLALYGGQAKRRELGLAAAGKRFSGEMAYELGKAKQTAGYLGAAGTILGGVSGMSEKYGRTRSAPAGGRYG